MRVGILGSALMGRQLGTIYAISMNRKKPSISPVF